MLNFWPFHRHDWYEAQRQSGEGIFGSAITVITSKCYICTKYKQITLNGIVRQ